jgi:hypothetical protein
VDIFWLRQIGGRRGRHFRSIRYNSIYNARGHESTVFDHEKRRHKSDKYVYLLSSRRNLFFLRTLMMIAVSESTLVTAAPSLERPTATSSTFSYAGIGSSSLALSCSPAASCWSALCSRASGLEPPFGNRQSWPLCSPLMARRGSWIW